KREKERCKVKGAYQNKRDKEKQTFSLVPCPFCLSLFTSRCRRQSSRTDSSFGGIRRASRGCWDPVRRSPYRRCPPLPVLPSELELGSRPAPVSHQLWR